MGIILTILLFGVLIFIHEFGHFITAKLSGVKVHEFALGMGPVIWKTRKKDTQYALRLLPIGGFVSMEGEDEESEEEGSFSKARVWNKILIVTAGALMNLILGFLLLVIVVSQQSAIGTTTIARFEEGATSSQLLQVDDKILKINGSSINIDYDIILSLIHILQPRRRQNRRYGKVRRTCRYRCKRRIQSNGEGCCNAGCSSQSHLRCV